MVTKPAGSGTEIPVTRNEVRFIKKEVPLPTYPSAERVSVLVLLNVKDRKN